MQTEGMKTKEGISSSARQRRAESPVEIHSCSVSSEFGSLCLSISTGDERGVQVSVSITLDELISWLPELIEQERKWAAQVGRIEQQGATRAATFGRSGTGRDSAS
ncbi:hypothetical protein [Paracoccus aestuarii]|uniref:hypothetical protein n=1 Tax=Paracoccus aestuarii TaxID=453842 RepID=UPI0011C40C8F|nr:hypothetical protein [Paracoccus aestuarii]WCR01340.1 hypothetical protein JHW48_18220 [Paracoccus aestuarii]